LNPTRTGVLDILLAMNADIEIRQQQLVDGEPVATIVARASRLRGVDVPTELVPSAIDEFPIICIAAACAEGTTRITEAAELRVKESDRIAQVAKGLQTLGSMRNLLMACLSWVVLSAVVASIVLVIIGLRWPSQLPRWQHESRLKS